MRRYRHEFLGQINFCNWGVGVSSTTERVHAKGRSGVERLISNVGLARLNSCQERWIGLSGSSLTRCGLIRFRCFLLCSISIPDYEPQDKMVRRNEDQVFPVLKKMQNTIGMARLRNNLSGYPLTGDIVNLWNTQVKGGANASEQAAIKSEATDLYINLP